MVCNYILYTISYIHIVHRVYIRMFTKFLSRERPSGVIWSLEVQTRHLMDIVLDGVLNRF